MPFEWKRLVNVARQLEEQAGKDELNAEALQRSAVGRAYYAAFGHARSYAQSFLGYKVKGDADDHGALRAHLKRSRRGGDAQRLDSLRWWRNDADYADELPWADAKIIVAEAIKAAEKLINSLTPPKSGSESN